MVGIGFKKATARSGKTVEKWKIILNLKEILTDTESVGLFSDTNLENSKKRDQADNFSRHITRGMRVGLLLMFLQGFPEPVSDRRQRHHAFVVIDNI